jgi:tRNA(Ile)-lysidine synthase TilS/MesJ
MMLQKWVTLSSKDQFTPECEDVAKQHINLLHTEIWWPSIGEVLNRMFELKGELQDYFQASSKPDFAKCFEDEEWPEKLAYIAHIFNCMNQSDKSLQGPEENVLT